jgi:succinyl-CoA synthetase beta subunit
MEIFESFGIPVPKTRSATTVEDAERIYRDEFGVGNDCVIKAMVLTGGRGLGHFNSGLQGGVHICRSVEDVARYARKMIGFNLITKQTTSVGLPCNRIMLAERMYLRREMYISIMLDRAAGGAIFVVSPYGGTSIEDVAAATPEAIYKQPIDIATGVTAPQAKFLAKALGFKENTPAFQECQDTIFKLYDMFTKRDCLLLEINPFAETPDGKVMICDAKIDFDNNSEFRQKDVFLYRDRSQEDTREVEVRGTLNSPSSDRPLAGCEI